MNKKLKKILISVVIISVVILLAEGGFVLYTYFQRENTKSYFDSINAYQEISDDGGYIAVGSNNDNKKLYEKGKITKYNSKKEKVWEKFYNKGYNSTFTNVAADGKSYVVVGSFEKEDPEKQAKKDKKSLVAKDVARTALFVKYDDKGEVVFEKTLQILGNSKFVNVKVVEDGYIVVGQSIFENMVLGMDTRGGGVMVKYDKTGKELWRTNYGGAKSGLFNDLVVDDENIYVVGKDAARVGTISKYTLDGERIKTTNYEYTDTLGFSSIVKVGDQLIVVGAKKLKEDQFDYDTDALIVKYDLDCDLLDEVTYKGEKTGMERFNKIIADDENNLVIIGHTAIKDEKESTKALNVFKYDGILAKYKTSLKKVYTEHYGEWSYDDYFTDVEQIKNDYLISGYSSYRKDGYLSKFITYSKQGKSLEVK